MAITFHSGNQIPFQEYWEAGKKLEAFFHTDQDTNQAEIKPAEGRWIVQHIPECVTIIKDGKKVIGLTFFFPTSPALMHAFIQKRISEHTLWEKTKARIHEPGNTCIYLSSAFMDQEYRGRGIARRAIIQSLKKYTRAAQRTPPFFYWNYSAQGKILAEYVAREFNSRLYEKKIRPRKPIASARTRNKPRRPRPAR